MEELRSSHFLDEGTCADQHGQFSSKVSQRHPIAHLWVQDVERILWIYILYTAPVTAILHRILCYMEQHGGTQLHIKQTSF